MSIVSPCRLLQIEDLLAETEAFNKLLVAADILLVQVNEQTPALADEFKQAAFGMEIMAVNRHMTGQLVYAFR
jgi:hypothetical protein